MIEITNISGGLIVGDLLNGSFRLNNRETMTVKDNEINTYIKTLESKGLIKIKEYEKMRKES